MIRFAAPLLVAVTACTASSPRPFVEDYREAVRARDWQKVDDISLKPPGIGGTGTSTNAPELRELDERLAGSITSVEHRATVTLESGHELVLVRTQAGWQVVTGGVHLARTETPEQAFQTLCRGVREDRLALVRSVIPKEASARYEDDTFLRVHLGRHASRLRRAELGIEAQDARQAMIDGPKARLSYGDGLAVTFLLEERRWKVVDLE